MKFVKIPGKDFEMQTTPVTQSQWQKVMGNNPSFFKGDNNPVERVSFYDVEEFIKKLNESQNEYTYRLPTKDEWVYCALGNEEPVKESELSDYAWYLENSDGRTHPVGLKKPNSFGLYDTLGNVWEWNSMAIEGTYDSYRGLRGGSWGSFARYCRVARRNRVLPDARYEYFGFRLARIERSELLRSNSLPSIACDSRAEVQKLLKQIKIKIQKIEELLK